MTRTNNGTGGGLTCCTAQEPPVCSEPPPHVVCAEAVSESTHINTNTENPFFILSPVVKVVKFKAGSAPASDEREYTAQLDSLIRTGKLNNASELCHERLSIARDEPARLLWTKDLAVVRRIEGNYESALDLLASSYPSVTHFEDTLRGKYENGFGRTYELLKRFNKAFDHYTAADHYHGLSGNPDLQAGTNNNLGRLYTSAGNPEASFEYFDRATKLTSDERLLSEVDESRALAFERLGRLREAWDAASRSVSRVIGTEHVDVLIESGETCQRILIAIQKGGDTMRRL